MSSILTFQKTFTVLLATIAFAVLSFLMMTTQPASAAYNPIEEACSGAAASSPSCQDATANGDKNPLTGSDGLIIKISRIVAAIVGVASIIMIILGGYTYTFSGGDPQKLSAAKNTILYAIIGLIIAASAQVLIAFIVNKIL